MLACELPTTARELAVPFVLVQGEDDMITPTSVAVHYFEAVRAPAKQLVVLPHAGHFAIVTDREAFAAALVSHVLPLARRREHLALRGPHGAWSARAGRRTIDP